MRYTGPKVKKARRLNMAFTAKDTKYLQKKGYPPGQHGQTKSRLSEYGMQLREKQKAKFQYGITEKQFLNYFKKALKQPGVTGENLLKMLELRLDNLVYRAGFAETRPQARQLVSHGFFEVNNRKVNIPSFILKVNNVVALRQNKRNKKNVERIAEKIKNFKTQEWLELEPNKLTVKIITLPSSVLTNNIINTQLIVEHYSRI